MIASLPPGWIMMFGAFLVPLLPKRWQPTGWLSLPLLSLIHILSLGVGDFATIEMVGNQMTFARVDALSRVFGIIFHIVAALGFVT